MSTVQAISDKRVVKKAEKYLKRHHDEVYWLIWRIGIETGLRITDITKLSYDNINFESGEVTVIESKGTLARQARARHKVLKSVKMNCSTITSVTMRSCCLFTFVITGTSLIWSLAAGSTVLK